MKQNSFTTRLWELGNATIPKGPKIEKIKDRPPGLNISSEIEMFTTKPLFCGEF